MIHTFLSHKILKLTLSCVSQATQYSPGMEPPTDIQTREKGWLSLVFWQLPRASLQGNSAGLPRYECFAAGSSMYPCHTKSCRSGYFNRDGSLLNPNTREPKKRNSWLRTHGTLPSLEPPSRLPWSFSFLFSTFSRSLLVAIDQPWRTQQLPWLSCTSIALVGSLSYKKSFAFSIWATRRTKKLDGESFTLLVGSLLVLSFLLSCVKQLVGKKSLMATLVRTPWRSLEYPCLPWSRAVVLPTLEWLSCWTS